ncbi:MAG: GspMb/PilO family protein [Acidobacteriota bacterium]
MALRRILGEHRVSVAILTVAILANIAAAVLVVLPMARSVRTGQFQMENAARAEHDAAQDFAAANATINGRARATEDLKQFYEKVLPADLPGARRATYLKLIQLARDAQLKAQRRTEAVHQPRPVDVATGVTLTRLGISMVLRGPYESVRQFLRDVEAASEFIVIDDVGLVEGTEPGSALVLTVELSTYYRMATRGN